MADLNDAVLPLAPQKREEVTLEPMVMPAAEEPPPPPDSPPPAVHLDIVHVEEPQLPVPAASSRRRSEHSGGGGRSGGGGGHGKPCPQCGSERHKKKPITCPFKLWTDDFPIVPRWEKESLRDAHRRHWESARHVFVSQGQYVKGAGWTYAGPPSHSLPNISDRSSSRNAQAAGSSGSASSMQHHSYSFSPLHDKHLPSTSLLDLDVNGDSDDDISRDAGPCPECGVVRHKKKPITCAFRLWTEDFPTVPRFEGESMRDAQQRIWAIVRMHFLENGQYVRKEGYTFQGPPGVDLPNLGSFDAAIRTPNRTPLMKSSMSLIATPLMLGDNSSDNEDNRPLRNCPECGLERHKKKPVTCPFKQWTLDFPDVQRLPGERSRDAHYRLWPSVRDQFVENDQYVKRDTWASQFNNDLGDMPPTDVKIRKRSRDEEDGLGDAASIGIGGGMGMNGMHMMHANSMAAMGGGKRGKTEDADAKRCPECGAERHRKRPSTCPFKQWTEDYPSVPRLGREHIRDAQRRIWKHVRKMFLDSEGKYVKREGWTYTGVGSYGHLGHSGASASGVSDDDDRL